MAKISHEYACYEPLSEDEMRTRFVELSMVIEQGLEVFGISPSDTIANSADLMETIERVEKRRVYFWVYYGIEMSEKNEAALYCFWLLKFLPLRVKDKPGSEVNVKIALYILLNALTYITRKTGHKMSLDGNYINHLAYAFKYRDISKEAIMSIIESLLA